MINFRQCLAGRDADLSEHVEPLLAKILAKVAGDFSARIKKPDRHRGLSSGPPPAGPRVFHITFTMCGSVTWIISAHKANAKEQKRYETP
ncbi:hypothetical protein [Roseiarcus sp.]|uniref:hypothetical protein n=1 Tax=Roseiarcus sp. TaxID=1969460 RepID=UPI003C4604CE